MYIKKATYIKKAPLLQKKRTLKNYKAVTLTPGSFYFISHRKPQNINDLSYSKPYLLLKLIFIPPFLLHTILPTNQWFQYFNVVYTYTGICIFFSGIIPIGVYVVKR